MNLKRLSSLCCLSSLVCCNLSNPASANMEGRVATKSDIDTIVNQNLQPLMKQILQNSLKQGNDTFVKYIEGLSANAYEFYSKKSLSDFSKISNELCKGLSELKYLDCLTVSTYFSDLLTKKGIQNGVAYFPCFKNDSSYGKNSIDPYSMHALVAYAYNDGKNSSYVFADPYNFILGEIKDINNNNYNINKLTMNLSTVLSSNIVDAYDNWILSDNEKSPYAIPLMNWINDASKKNKINIDKYNKIANTNFNFSNKFKTLIKINDKWMIKKGGEEIDEDRPFRQHTTTLEVLEFLNFFNSLNSNKK